MPPYTAFMVSGMNPYGKYTAGEYSAITQRQNAAMNAALARERMAQQAEQQALSNQLAQQRQGAYESRWDKQHEAQERAAQQKQDEALRKMLISDQDRARRIETEDRKRELFEEKYKRERDYLDEPVVVPGYDQESALDSMGRIGMGVGQQADLDTLVPPMMPRWKAQGPLQQEFQKRGDALAAERERLKKARADLIQQEKETKRNRDHQEELDRIQKKLDESIEKGKAAQVLKTPTVNGGFLGTGGKKNRAIAKNFEDWVMPNIERRLGEARFPDRGDDTSSHGELIHAEVTRLADGVLQDVMDDMGEGADIHDPGMVKIILRSVRTYLDKIMPKDAVFESDDGGFGVEPSVPPGLFSRLQDWVEQDHDPSSAEVAKKTFQELVDKVRGYVLGAVKERLEASRESKKEGIHREGQRKRLEGMIITPGFRV